MNKYKYYLWQKEISLPQWTVEKKEDLRYQSIIKCCNTIHLFHLNMVYIYAEIWFKTIKKNFEDLLKILRGLQNIQRDEGASSVQRGKFLKALM